MSYCKLLQSKNQLSIEDYIDWSTRSTHFESYLYNTINSLFAKGGLKMLPSETIKSYPITSLAEKLGHKPPNRNEMTHCMNGTDNTPSLKLYIDKNDFYCYRCGIGGSGIDLIMHDLSCDFTTAIRYGCDLIGSEINVPVYTMPALSLPKVRHDYTRDYQLWRNNIHKTNYHRQRGISDATAERFWLGYNSKYNTLIIPTSKYSFVARSVDPLAPVQKRHVGENHFLGLKQYNPTKPVSIVEGEFSALSVFEAGGQAISLGGVGNLGNAINALKQLSPKAPVILMLDNDAAGKQASEAAEKTLVDKDINYLVCQYPEPDPNDWLVSDRNSFISEIQKAGA
jgi:DNA primase